MSNKSSGTAFEREWAQMLADHGFWAHCLKDNANGQPFDVIAARNGTAYVFDCKECTRGRFQLSRIEENQKNAMALWSETGNTMGMFVLKFEKLIVLVPSLPSWERGLKSVFVGAGLRIHRRSPRGSVD